MKQYVNLQVFRDFRKVRFYTFQIENSDKSETDKFFTKLKTDMSVSDDLNRLVQWIVEIGSHHSALIELFRFEEEAHALPPPPKGQRQLGITQIENNDLRREIGKAGRETVVKSYSVYAHKDTYLSVLKSLIK